jgi:hypothetical protein
MSMVIPRSRSAFSLSSTHAYLKEPLPNSAASCVRVSELSPRHCHHTSRARQAARYFLRCMKPWLRTFTPKPCSTFELCVGSSGPDGLCVQSKGKKVTPPKVPLQGSAVPDKVATQKFFCSCPAGMCAVQRKCALPSRTSRWYACRYHRTCRSSLYQM